MSFQGPPRGSGGRHWRDDTPPTGARRPYREPHPSDTQMSPPMSARPDLVVPRVFLEPDPDLDALRRSAWRWGRWRDVLVIAVCIYLLCSWLVPPVWRAVGG